MILGIECDLPHPYFLEVIMASKCYEMERTRSTRDKIQWELANNGNKLTRSVLRRRVGIRYADLDPILEELERDGKIRRVELGSDKKRLQADDKINLFYIHEVFKIHYRTDFLL
jgi:DNA-binding Lrp family transcriptional regulator